MLSTKKLNNLCFKFNRINSKWTCIACVRAKSSAEPKTKTYSHTIIFPKTDFPVRSNNAEKEKNQEAAQFSKLYNWQREHLKGPEYILHDGPPYANGDLHMGHAVNKIIKDINNRSQVLQGNKVHYVPGWDCHGLPIELKALQQYKKSTKNAPNDPLQIRKIARKFALKTVERQKEAFESWGVMADWENQCYLTLNKDYVQKQLRQFYKMYKAGLIYRALKPVYWSHSSKTALAEAELEYDPQYKSTEVYVTFPVENVPDVLKDKLVGKSLSAIIWTTTPWTLPANKAVCYSPQLKYSVITLSSKPGELFLVASPLIEELEKIFDVVIGKVFEFDGTLLQGTTYKNNLSDTPLPFLQAAHVTDAKGTGLVHTAPAHGPDDFLVALNNDMTVECNVDEAGCYINLDPSLDGLPVLTEGQEAVIVRLGSNVLHKGQYVHSYPLDWRTKQPVILRASHQWFIDTARLKEQALEALEKVEILPPSTAEQSRQGFRAQLEKRPYWCISRQRAWGVPIPVLYQGEQAVVDENRMLGSNNTILGVLAGRLDSVLQKHWVTALIHPHAGLTVPRRVIDKLCNLIESEGPDVWWTCGVRDLVTDDVAMELDLDSDHITKGKDIMDIWLDSGLSWQTLDGRAALYAEGVDQLTGWFQASLLTSIALTQAAPYRSIFVHGFVVDGKRRKMSKSLGNVIDPTTIMHGGPDKSAQPAYGVDTLRWWVASHATQHSQIVISKKLLTDCQTEVSRIRNIFKYLLGVISDVDELAFHDKPLLNYFDQYMVNEGYEFMKLINEHYNNFRYNTVAQIILFFISNKVSGLYCHCIKDRLYCSPKSSVERLSAQLVVHTLFVSLCKALGPVLPHLVEEAWQHHPLHRQPFYFTESIPLLKQKSIDEEVMEIVIDLKRDIFSKSKSDNLKKFEAKIEINRDLYNRIKHLNSQDGVHDSVLCEILEVSSVRLKPQKGGKWDIELTVSDQNQCLRCRKFNALDNSDKCLRCEKALELLGE